MSHTIHDTEQIIEHAYPRRVKVTDTRYGLRTASRQEYDAARRADFIAGQRAGLEKQRDGVQARLDILRNDVRKIVVEVQTGKRIVNADMLAKVQRLKALEIKLLADITRLNDKITATG